MFKWLYIFEVKSQLVHEMAPPENQNPLSLHGSEAIAHKYYDLCCLWLKERFAPEWLTGGAQSEGQWKCTALSGRGSLALAGHAPAQCSHNGKSRCSWEIWQHVGETKHSHKDVKTVQLSGCFSLPLKMQPTSPPFSESSRRWWEVGWQRAINARLKDGHSSLSVWCARCIWFPICMYAQEASDGWADIYLEHPALVGLVTPVLMSESKCQERLVAVCYPHRWAFFILCAPHAALHLGNSGEKLNVPVLWREQD